MTGRDGKLIFYDVAMLKFGKIGDFFFSAGHLTKETVMRLKVDLGVFFNLTQIVEGGVVFLDIHMVIK